MKRFVPIIFLLSSVLCYANNVLSNCIQEALRQAITIIEQNDLSIHRSIGRDSLDERYQNLLKLPHKYFIDGYSYCISVGGNISLDTKCVYLTNNIKKEIEHNFNNITFTFDSIAYVGAKNNIKEHGYLMYHGIRKNPTELFELLEISDVYLRGEELSVVICFCIMDDYLRILRSPINIGFTYTLNEGGSWTKNDSIWIRNENVSYQSQLDIRQNLSDDKFFNELDCIVPFAYSKFNLLKDKLRMCTSVSDYKKNTNNCTILLGASDNSIITIPDEIVPEDNEYWFADSMMYGNVNLIEYRDAKFLYNYDQTADTMAYRDKLKDISDKVDAQYKYVMGSPEISLKADSITVKFDYYEVIAASEVIADEKWGIVNPPARMLLEPKLEYSVLFLYDRDDKKWVFVEDRIEAKNSPKIYIEKSNKDYFYRLENVSTYK